VLPLPLPLDFFDDRAVHGSQLPVAAEAWRRVEAGELADGGL